MQFDVYCGRVPTDEQCSKIRDLMSRTTAKIRKPFYSHVLCLSGPCASEALALFSHAGCNVTTKTSNPTSKYAVSIGVPPRSFRQNRKQVLED